MFRGDGEVQLCGQRGAADRGAGVGEGAGLDALPQCGEVGSFLQDRDDDEFGVRRVTEETGPGGADPPVAFDLFGHRLGQGPGGQGGTARGTARGDRQVTGAVGGDQQRE